MADNASIKISLTGVALGGAALMIALVHFWGGPFAPQPSIERSVAETAVAIRDATIAAMRGEEIEDTQTRSDYDIDRILEIASVVLGGLAVILGVVGYAKGEPARAAGGAAVLGAGAIAFKFAVVALGAIVFAILVFGVLSGLGFD